MNPVSKTAQQPNPAYNKAQATRFFLEAFNQGNLGVVDETIALNYKFNGQPQSRQDIKEWVTGLRTTFPDLHFTIQAILAEGNMVALRWQLTGTHTGGPNPTGNKAVNSGTNIITFDASGMGIDNMQNGQSIITGSLTFDASEIYHD
ncbi:MAG TPA: ester cyclase [Bryobacteraceae bacterium]|jgi:predicted ester cyclase